MQETTKTHFFETIGPLDVSPNHANPDFTDWKSRSGQVIGRSIPGWRNGYTNGKPTPRQYFLK